MRKLEETLNDLEDLFIAHIQGADTFARGLVAVEYILTKTPYVKMLKERYESYDSGQGNAFENAKLSIEDLLLLIGKFTSYELIKSACKARNK